MEHGAVGLSRALQAEIEHLSALVLICLLEKGALSILVVAGRHYGVCLSLLSAHFDTTLYFTVNHTDDILS